MKGRTLFSTLFFISGFIFFGLATVNFWQASHPDEGEPVEEAISTSNAIVDMQQLTSKPITGDTTFDFQRIDVVSAILVPANYGCNECPQRVNTYLDAFTSHPIFNDLSTDVFTVIIASSERKATHFTRIHQFGFPTFRLGDKPPAIREETTEDCVALTIDTSTMEVLLKVHLEEIDVTDHYDTIFETSRESYLQATP